MLKIAARLLLATVIMLGALLLWMYREARMDPVVHTAQVHLPHWPKGAPPVRVALLSDIHAGAASVTPARLAQVVERVNAQHPDLILIAGDFTPARDPIEVKTVREKLAPLKGLHARLGTVAVLGNHDHWTGAAAVRAALNESGIAVLQNEAVAKGPLAIGAVDDDYSDHADIGRTVAAARRLPGARLILTHSPDIAPKLPADFPLLLAGHTHCGQAVIPFHGSVLPVSRFGDRYRCGIIREGNRATIVTAGIGTSGPALRFNAPPDIWLLTLGP